jgi:hypothetical protein
MYMDAQVPHDNSIVRIDCKGLTSSEIKQIEDALTTASTQLNVRLVEIVELKESFPETRTTLGFIVPHLHLIVSTVLGTTLAMARNKLLELILDHIKKVIEKRSDRKDEELEPAVLYQPDGKVAISFKRPKTPTLR